MAARASINPISNAIDLPGLSGVPLEYLLMRQLPPTEMLSFLHEVTHHWCFTSTVGLAQTLLYSDAIFELVGKGLLNKLDSVEVRKAYAKCIIADEALEPLYEGLAVFSEQRLLSTTSPTASYPLTLTGMWFGIGLNTSFYEELAKTVTQVRRTEANLDRLTRLFSSPGDPGISPYLPGFIAVSSCFGRAGRGTTALRDPDLFAQYFRSFMFEDFQLASLLLDRSCNDLSLFRRRIEDRLRIRLHRFMEMDHTSEVESFTRWILRQPEPHSLAARAVQDTFLPDEIYCIGIDREVRRSCEREIAARSSEILTAYRSFADGDGDNGTVVYAMVRDILDTRAMLRIAERQVWLHNSGRDTFILDSQEKVVELLNGGSAPAVVMSRPVPDGPAVLECMSYGPIPFFVVRECEPSINNLATFPDGSRSGKVLATFGHIDTGTIPPPPIRSHSATDSISTVSRGFLPPNQASDKLEEIEKIVRSVGDYRSDNIRIYGPLIKFHHSGDRELSPRFLEDGFLGVLNSNALTKCLALLHIYGEFCVPEELSLLGIQPDLWNARHARGSIRWSYEDALMKLVERASAEGWDLVAWDRRSNLSVVIPC